MDITALIDSLNRLLIGVDNLSSVADTVSAQVTSSSSTVIDILETTGSNLITQLGHLSAVTEAASGNLTTQIGALVAALAPGASPLLRALPTTPALQAREIKETIPTAQAAGGQVSGGAAGAATTALEKLGSGATQAGQLAAQAGTRLGGLTAPLSALGSLFSNLAPVVGPLGPVFAVAGETVGKVTQSFERVVGVMGQFVEAAAPAVMFEFNRALRDLQATVGTAFAPFFQAMIGITRQVAGELFPAMQTLQPVFASLADVVGGVLVPVANLFANVLQTLTPVFALFGTVVKLVSDLLFTALSPVITYFANLAAVVGTILDPILRVVGALLTLTSVFNPVMLYLQVVGGLLGGVAKLLGAVFEALDPFIRVLEKAAEGVQFVFSVFGAIFSATIQTVVDAFKALLPVVDLSDAFAFLRNATLSVAKALIELAIKIAAFFGNTTFAGNLIKSLQGLAGAPGKETAIAAPQNVKTSGLEAIAREMNEAAARAVGTGEGGAKKETADLLGELIKFTEEAAKGNTNAIGDLSKQIDKILEGIKEGVRNIIRALLGESKEVGGGVASGVGAGLNNYIRDRDAEDDAARRIRAVLGISERGA